MSETLVIRPHRRRRSRAASRVHTEAWVAGAETATAARPALALAEPDDPRERLVTGAITAALHAAALTALVVAAALAPPELIERVIPVELVPPRPVERPGSNQEPAPAPAGPKQVGARRANAAALASAQALTPEQAAALRQAALESARRAIEQMQVEAERAPTLPTQIARREAEADRVAARAAAAVSPAEVVTPREVAPVAIDPVDLAALAPSVEGPRKIDPSSLTDLSSQEALAALSSIPETDHRGAVTAGALPSTGSLAGGGVAVGIDTGVAGAYAGGGGGGGGDGPGVPGGTGGQGTAVGVVRCLESASVQRYLDGVQKKTSQRWTVPEGVAPDEQVVLRFHLDAAGMANDVRGSEADEPTLSNSARRALLSANPFPPLTDANRCLADKRIVLTFTVPAR